MPIKKPARPKTPKISFLKASQRFSSAQLTALAGTLAVVGIFVVLLTHAADNKLEKFVNNPGRGWVWDGLHEPKVGSACKKGSFEVINSKTGETMSCTHGPDAAPVGVNVKNRVQPVQTGEADSTALAPAGGTATAPAGGSVSCDGDGATGNRVQLIYAHASDVHDNYSSYASSFQTWAGNLNNSFVQSGLATGQARNIRFVTDANCNASIERVTLSAIGDDNFANTTAELRNLGYYRADRKYLVWMDANILCGIASFRSDDQPGDANINNYGNTFARVDNGCWGAYDDEAHELMHLLGGVQASAPNGTSGSHCTDDFDRMCYDEDASSPNYGGYTKIVCNDLAKEKLFDCNHDDYFYAGTPPVGNYLATHWNTANNVFLFAGSASPPAGDTVIPTVIIAKPLNDSKVGSNTAIAASATDNVRVIKSEIYIDGVLKATSTSGSTSYNWKSAKASAGSHTITVKAYDAAGNMGINFVTVTK